nr:hypothetical protein [Tanacetum cinerariifolium]
MSWLKLGLKNMALTISSKARSVELINNLDAGNPLYLQSNHNSSLAIVNVKLVGAKNYKMWSIAMKIALIGKIRWVLLMHMIDSTKDMFNVVDISSLMLTVGHPNRTLAKITAISSLRLTIGIVLFDVLVIHEYNDLSLDKIVRTGSESSCLYLFDINKIGKSDNATREPFPSSDHKSKFVGDIVHCDVWGPYRVLVRMDVKAYENVFPFKMKSSNESVKDYDKNIDHLNGLNEFEEHNLNFFDVQRSERPYDEEGDTSNGDGNIGVTSDGYDNTVKDEVTNVATQIEESITLLDMVLKSMFDMLNFLVVVNLEMEALHRNNTYVFVGLLPRRKAIG